MSNFKSKAYHPLTGKIETVNMMDNHFGHHLYGVEFPDGLILHEADVKFPNNVDELTPPANPVKPNNPRPKTGLKKGERHRKAVQKTGEQKDCDCPCHHPRGKTVPLPCKLIGICGKCQKMGRLRSRKTKRRNYGGGKDCLEAGRQKAHGLPRRAKSEG